MRNLIVILAVLLPIFSLSQKRNKVVTTKNIVYYGDIIDIKGNYLRFVIGAEPILESNRLEIALVNEIYGPLAKSTKKEIMSKNGSIVFHPNISFAAFEPRNPINKHVSAGDYLQKARTQHSAGDYIQKAGTRYLAGLGVALAGSAVLALSPSTDVPENTRIAGGVMVLAGGIISLTGHFQLIKAGKVMNGEAVSLSPSKEGIGFAINF